MAASRRRKPRPSRRWLRALFLAFTALFLAFAAWLVVEGATVRLRFEGRRWDVPARVYASPFELALGASLDAARLEHQLESLSYRKQQKADAPGTYARQGSRFTIATRGFRFWDSSEPPRVVELTLSKGALTRMRAGQDSLPLLRLEPLELGSLYRGSTEDRLVLTPEEIPPKLRAALIAVEDRRFDSHFGVDPAGILRALVGNLSAGRIRQGGSTLTQQLVKNYFLDSRRTLWRKAREAVMALALEAQYSKDELFTAYANEIHLGQDGARAIHGFGLASRFYFGRPLDELDDARLALLVTLVRGASHYDPWRHPQRARERRDLVLEILENQQVLSSSEREAAQAQPLGVIARGEGRGGYHPAFLELVRAQLSQDYPPEALEVEGLTIFTTLEPEVQRQAEEALAMSLKKKPKLEGAVVVTRPGTGEVLALVGGRDASFAGFDRARNALRPIGSLIKPFVLLAALESERFHLASLVENTPLEVPMGRDKPWKPQNADRSTSEKVPLFQALARSLNLPFVRAGLEVTPEEVARTLSRLGLERPIAAHPSLLLGSLELSPFEVARLYGALASGGFQVRERAVREVLDHRGQPLQRYPLELSPVATPAAVAQTTQAMTLVFERGTAQAAKASLPPSLVAAGKTGTTDDNRDSWFAGFTGDLLAVVWVGADDNSPTGLTGASGALPVWTRLISQLAPGSFEAGLPEGLSSVLVDWESGELVTEGCGDGVRILVPSQAELPTRAGCGPSRPGLLRRAVDWFRGKNQ